MELRADAAGASLNENVPPDILLHIFGNNYFNNEILANFLGEHTGIACRHLTKSTMTEELKLLPEKIYLTLADFNSLKELNYEENLCLEKAALSPNFRLVLFHVDPERKVERNLFRKGVRGILYRNQPISIYLKAIQAVLEGELWYPRRTLEQLFLEQALPLSISTKFWQAMSARQKEILRLLAAGKSNREIAEKLCLSHHTIKTHIYHIYKKMGVRNRLEAVVRASEEVSADSWFAGGGLGPAASAAGMCQKC